MTNYVHVKRDVLVEPPSAKSRSWTSGRSVFGRKSKRWKPLLQASQKASERSGRLETMEAEKITLGSDLEGLRSQISDLSSQIADVDRRADEIERGLPILRARRASLGERFGVARAAVVKAIEGLREVPNIVSAWAQELARKMGKHLFDPNSIDYRSREMWEATRAVDALNRDRPHAPQQRGRGAR